MVGILDGGDGNDVLYGGNGDDHLLASGWFGWVMPPTTEVYDGGAGFDLLVVQDVTDLQGATLVGIEGLAFGPRACHSGSIPWSKARQLGANASIIGSTGIDQVTIHADLSGPVDLSHRTFSDFAPSDQQSSDVLSIAGSAAADSRAYILDLYSECRNTVRGNRAVPNRGGADL